MKTYSMTVEIPQNSYAKYEIKDGVIKLDRTVYIPYPRSYGFIDNTLAEDGDELDAILLDNVDLHPGIKVEVVPVGILWMDDNGIIDNKIIVMSKSLYISLNNSDAINLYINEQKDIFSRIEYFFSNYKTGTFVEELKIENVDIESYIIKE